LRRKQTIFAQGDGADAVFYLQKGKVRLAVVSKIGKEATIAIVSEGHFFGEGSLAGQLLRMGSAVAMTDCEILRVEKKAMMDVLHREPAFSERFVAYLLARNIRYEESSSTTENFVTKQEQSLLSCIHSGLAVSLITSACDAPLIVFARFSGHPVKDRLAPRSRVVRLY
jgi:CRP-like cAMP-binding protein